MTQKPQLKGKKLMDGIKSSISFHTAYKKPTLNIMTQIDWKFLKNG